MSPSVLWYLKQARSQGGGGGGHDPPMKLTVACAAGHFAPARPTSKRKVVQTLAHYRLWTVVSVTYQL